MRIQQLNIPDRKIQPVGDQRFAVEQIEISQPDQQVFCIMMVAMGDIVAVFRGVNMQPAAGCLQGLGEHTQALIRDSERRVSADMGLHQIRGIAFFLCAIYFASKANVFLNASP